MRERGFPSGSEVNNLPTVQEMQEPRVQFPDWEDTPEEEMVTHSSILAWQIPWIEQPSLLHSIGSQRVGHD